jgi:serine/threonine-protein kinase
VVGRAQDEAESLLEAAGLVPILSKQDSDAPEGQVIAQQPGAGVQARKGDRVTMTVSTGVREVSVPRVIGLTTPEARAAIRDAGLEVEVRRKRTEDEGENEVVLIQRPDPGTVREEGRTVVILVGRYEPPAAPPADGDEQPGGPSAPPPAQ